jgi:hypothetical protein
MKNVPEAPEDRQVGRGVGAKLNERGMLRSRFVRPREVRELRDFTRLRADLVEDRSRHKQRLEKLLEDGVTGISS